MTLHLYYHADWKGKMSPRNMSNAKRTDQFIRTKASTLKKVKESAKYSTPSNMYDTVFDASAWRN